MPSKTFFLWNIWPILLVATIICRGKKPAIEAGFLSMHSATCQNFSTASIVGLIYAS